MASSILCDGCGARYKLNPRLAGQVLKCPACGHGIQVPADSPGAAAPGASRAAVVCGGCQRKFAWSPQLAGKSVPCPDCGAVIQVAAADAPASSPPPARDPFDEQDDGMPIRLADESPSPSGAAAAAPPKKKKKKRKQGKRSFFSISAALEHVQIIAILGGIGVGVGGFGFNEMRLGSGASSQPAEVDLAKLEQGEPLTNKHIKLGPHIAKFDNSQFEYEKLEHDYSEPTESTRINYCLYPIVSEESHGGPRNQQRRRSVTVKTKRYYTVGDIPDGDVPMASVQGLITSDLNANALVVEEGRKPTGGVMVVIYFLLSVLMTGGAVAIFIYQGLYGDANAGTRE